MRGHRGPPLHAITFHDVRDVRCVAVPEPALREPHDALVRVTSAAICGSDLHPYRGHERGLDRGTILGHEFVGEVVAIGSGVRTVEVGQRVVSPFTTSCGACFYCRIGMTCRCSAGELFGWVAAGHGLHGAQAEFVRVPLAEGTLVPVPDAVDDAHALLAGDVLATGSFAAELAGLGPRDVVAVIGCGPVGICAITAAFGRGVARVFALDRDATRLVLAARFGAEPMDVAANVTEAIRRATEGRGVDAVLEAVGSPDATRLGYELVRFGGTIAAVGVHTEAQFAITPGEAYDKNLSYRAGRCPARRFVPGLLARMAQGLPGPDLADLFSHRVPLAAAPDAYRIFDERRDGCTKVLLRP